MPPTECELQDILLHPSVSAIQHSNMDTDTFEQAKRTSLKFSLARSSHGTFLTLALWQFHYLGRFLKTKGTVSSILLTIALLSSSLKTTYHISCIVQVISVIHLSFSLYGFQVSTLVSLCLGLISRACYPDTYIEASTSSGSKRKTLALTLQKCR